ncbi:L-2-hydroxyglutarate oxidase [Nocardioides sp. zg-1228]|uniref:L-2-hydroxyglutarate oxidase n=1 Tax=Nocardioides sp. zg-1228 TaxID=2763008 RepID=UPI00164365B8|nr:L-2-hydroxyglutarate oxidase [Nocardioides sp. zg-1228]MBC2931971.1 L-2-hydroxyglutarate oxidase [Nocardioides sp. zg-1228]QSF57527.1 L-2-hydroxyglutarate oxidase [Nocardioides sp. zg-1228]
MSAVSYAVIGGGILGAAVARRLQVVDPDASVTVWEKEDRLAAHQTGRNSGVVHAGLYYEPGSLKATLCRRGVGLLRDFCDEHDIAYDACGKVLVALDAAEEGRLDAIEAKALANGVPGIRRLSAGELQEIEPHVRGVGGLHSPSTAIVDFPGVTRRLAELVERDGGTVRLSTELTGVRHDGTGVVLTARTPDGPLEERFDRVVLCTGLWADHTAEQAGDTREPQVVPFRGEYLLLRPERRSLVNGLVYPVPDPRYPFLGVHLTPRVDGEVMVGPNAVLALAREGYDWRTVSARDLREIAAYDGFRRFARQHWRTGVMEMAGSLSRRRFVAAARRYVPELRLDDVVSGPSGIRAQALERSGALVDDFRITTRDRVTALRNAPSPAATSSLAIAEHVVDVVLGREVAR